MRWPNREKNSNIDNVDADIGKSLHKCIAAASRPNTSSPIVKGLSNKRVSWRSSVCRIFRTNWVCCGDLESILFSLSNYRVLNWWRFIHITRMFCHQSTVWSMHEYSLCCITTYMRQTLPTYCFHSPPIRFFFFSSYFALVPRHSKNEWNNVTIPPNIYEYSRIHRAQ